MTDNKPLTLYFDIEKETKNTFRYSEDTQENPEVCGSLYMKKWAIKKIGQPERLKITIEKVKAKKAN